MTRSALPCASADRPAPPGPSTPVAWASSRNRKAPWRSAMSARAAASARSPSMLNTVSVTMNRRPASPEWRARRSSRWPRVVVAEADLAHPRRLAAMVQAGVDQPVGEHQRRPRLRPRREQRGRDRGVGLPAGGEQQGRLRPLQPRDLGLHRLVDAERAAHQARGAGAGPIQRRPVAGARDQRRMARQAEVVVGGKVDQLPARPAAPGRRPSARPPAAAGGGPRRPRGPVPGRRRGRSGTCSAGAGRRLRCRPGPMRRQAGPGERNPRPSAEPGGTRASHGRGAP